MASKKPVGELIRDDATVACVDCGDQAVERPKSEPWTVADDGAIYCPACAPRAGIEE